MSNEGQYKIIDVSQGSPEWLELRRKFVTASDIPVLVGANPWKTIEELYYEKKTGQTKVFSEESKRKMELGHSVEERVRQTQRAFGQTFHNCVALSLRLPYLMASFDGFNYDSRSLLEVKYTERKPFKKECESLHWWQIQAQLLVSRAEICIYHKENDKGDIYEERISPNEKAFKEIERVSKWFYDLLQGDEMKFNKSANEDLGKNFLRLKDGESAKGVFRGEIYELHTHWAGTKSEVCTAPNCLKCESNDKPKFRFRLNFVVNENGTPIAKIFEQGKKAYNDLADLQESGYEIEKCLVKISRQGSVQNDTRYSIIPEPKWELNEAQIKKISKVQLHDLSWEAQNGKQEELPKVNEMSDQEFGNAADNLPF